MSEPQDRAAPAVTAAQAKPSADGRRRSLLGRRALVVGGTGGIGAAICRALAVRGASIIAHGGSSKRRLDETMAGILPLLAPGAAAEGFLLPLERPTELLALLPSLGTLDILVLSFGPFFHGSLAATGAAEWERLALLDLALPGAMASALLPSMASRGWGRILLVGGTRTDSIRAYSSNAAYAAAKTGLAVLAKSLAAEGARAGVGCMMICPGFVDTEYLDEAKRAALRARSPRARLLEPEEIAEPAVELLSADPCVASGAVLNLDGGLDLTTH